MPLKKVNTISIDFPLEYHDVVIKREQILKGDYAHSSELTAVFEYIHGSPYIGKVGEYDNVLELSFVLGSFVPTEKANPTKGVTNQQEIVESLIISTFIATSDLEIIRGFIDAIAELHPWEHPVIKCCVDNEWYIFNPSE